MLLQNTKEQEEPTDSVTTRISKHQFNQKQGYRLGRYKSQRDNLEIPECQLSSIPQHLQKPRGLMRSQPARNAQKKQEHDVLNAQQEGSAALLRTSDYSKAVQLRKVPKRVVSQASQENLPVDWNQTEKSGGRIGKRGEKHASNEERTHLTYDGRPSGQKPVQGTIRRKASQEASTMGTNDNQIGIHQLQQDSKTKRVPQFVKKHVVTKTLNSTKQLKDATTQRIQLSNKKVMQRTSTQISQPLAQCNNDERQLLNNIRRVNGKAENVYENVKVKSSAKKSPKEERKYLSVVRSKDMVSSAKKQVKTEPREYERNIALDSEQATSRAGSKDGQKFEAPGSIESVAESPERPVSKKEGPAKGVKIVSILQDVQDNQQQRARIKPRPQHPKDNKYLSVEEAAMKLGRQACETQREPKVSAFGSQELIRDQAQVRDGSNSTSKKMNLQKHLKFAKNNYARQTTQDQEIQRVPKAREFEITNRVDRFGGSGNASSRGSQELKRGTVDFLRIPKGKEDGVEAHYDRTGEVAKKDVQNFGKRNGAAKSGSSNQVASGGEESRASSNMEQKSCGNSGSSNKRNRRLVFPSMYEIKRSDDVSENVEGCSKVLNFGNENHPSLQQQKKSTPSRFAGASIKFIQDYQVPAQCQDGRGEQERATNQNTQMASKSVPKSRIALDRLKKDSVSHQILPNCTPNLHPINSQYTERDHLNNLNATPSFLDVDGGSSNIGSAVPSRNQQRYQNLQQSSQNREMLQQLIKKQKERMNKMDQEAIKAAQAQSNRQAIRKIVDSRERDNIASVGGFTTRPQIKPQMTGNNNCSTQNFNMSIKSSRAQMVGQRAPRRQVENHPDIAKSKTMAVGGTNKQSSALPGVLESQRSQSRLNNALVGMAAGKMGAQEDLQEDDFQQYKDITDSIKKKKKAIVSQNNEHDAATVPSKAAKARKTHQQMMHDDQQTVIQPKDAEAARRNSAEKSSQQPNEAIWQSNLSKALTYKRTNGQHLSRLKSQQSISGQPSVIQSVQSSRCAQSIAKAPTSEERTNSLKDLNSIKSYKVIKNLRALGDKQPEELNSKQHQYLSLRQSKSKYGVNLGPVQSINSASTKNYRYSSRGAGQTGGGGMDGNYSTSTSKFQNSNETDALSWKRKRNEAVAVLEDGGPASRFQSLPWKNQIRFRNNEMANGLSAQDKNMIAPTKNQGQEAGAVVANSNEGIPVISSRHKFGGALDAAPQKTDFASFGSAASPNLNRHEESKKRKLLQKQKSHIVLSPIMNLKDQQALESKDENPAGPKLSGNQIKNVQLRSARNLPQLKSHQIKPAGVKNIVKIHKISKIENNQITKNWMNSENLKISERSMESPADAKYDDIRKQPKNSPGNPRQRKQKSDFQAQSSSDMATCKNDVADEPNLETSRKQRGEGGGGSSSTERRRSTQEFKPSSACEHDLSKKGPSRCPNASSRSALSVLSSRSKPGLRKKWTATQRQFQNTISSKDFAERSNSNLRTKRLGEDSQPMLKPSLHPEVEIHPIDETIESKLSKQLLKSDESVKFLRQQDIQQVPNLSPRHSHPEEPSKNELKDDEPCLQSPRFDLLSSIKKTSSQKKSAQHLEISKSLSPMQVARNSRGQEEQKQQIRQFDVTSSQSRPSARASNNANELGLKMKQISDIPMNPSHPQANAFKQMISKVDDNFQLFSDRVSQESNHLSPRNDDKPFGENVEKPEVPKNSSQSKNGNMGSSDASFGNLGKTKKKVTEVKVVPPRKKSLNMNDHGAFGQVTLGNNDQNGGRVNHFLGCAAEDFKGLCDGLENLIELSRAEDSDSSPSHRNSIQFFEQHESLTRSQKRIINQQHADPCSPSNSSMQMLQKLQKKAPAKAKRQNPLTSAKFRSIQSDFIPRVPPAPVTKPQETAEGEKAEEINRVSKWQFYCHDNPQSTAKDLQGYEDEMMFNQQIDAIEIIQLNQGNLDKYRKGQPDAGTLRSLPIASLTIRPPQTILPPALDLLSPPGHHFDASVSDSNYRSLLRQGLLSLSAQRSQVSQKSNFIHEMENLLPPPDLIIAESRDSRAKATQLYNDQIDQIKLIDSYDGPPKHAPERRTGQPNIRIQEERRSTSQTRQQITNFQQLPSSKIRKPTCRKLLLSNNYVSQASMSASDSHIETLGEEDLARLQAQR